jgi:hypothetical protein
MLSKENMNIETAPKHSSTRSPTRSEDPGAPVWNPSHKTRKGFQEVWFMKLNDPTGNRALWLRFTLLVTRNGFQKISETWAIFFERERNREVTKRALKQTYPISSFQSPAPRTIRIGESSLSPEGTRGFIQSKGRSISWDIKLDNQHDRPVCFIPEGLKRLGIIKNDYWALSENLHASGSVTVDGTVFEMNNSAGMLGHISGPKNGHSWVWGHANTFVNEKGEPVPFIFDGITSKARLAGGLSTPRLSSFYFYYQGKHYQFNSVWNALHMKSKSTITEWNFQADRGHLSFRGVAKAEHKDFAGVTYEDTDGSLLYCSNSKLSDMKIYVYRSGKLEATFLANGTAAFEVVSRRKNPYVKILI